MPDLISEGRFERLKGKIRETWGNITDDDIAKAQGNLEQLRGSIKEKTGQTEDEVKRRFDDWDREEEELERNKR